MVHSLVAVGTTTFWRLCYLELVQVWFGHPMSGHHRSKIGCWLIFFFSLSLTSGKYSLVTHPLLESSHCCCHFVMDFWLSRCTISLFGILLKHIFLFLAASLASLSASSFPLCPACAFIHVNSICQFPFSRAVAFFLISAIRCFVFFVFLRDDRVILLSMYIFIVRGV